MTGHCVAKRSMSQHCSGRHAIAQRSAPYHCIVCHGMALEMRPALKRERDSERAEAWRRGQRYSGSAPTNGH
eukprot:4701746-Pyramimonas_sp.AAC.1